MKLRKCRPPVGPENDYSRLLLSIKRRALFRVSVNGLVCETANRCLDTVSVFLCFGIIVMQRSRPTQFDLTELDTVIDESVDPGVDGVKRLRLTPKLFD